MSVPTYCDVTGKVCFAGRSTARRHVTHLTRRVGLYGNLQPYPCKHCGAWHVGRRDYGRHLQKVGVLPRTVAL